MLEVCFGVGKNFAKLMNFINEVKRLGYNHQIGEKQTIWHTIERIFGYLPTLNSQKIYTVDFKGDYSFVVREESEPSGIPTTQSF